MEIIGFRSKVKNWIERGIKSCYLKGFKSFLKLLLRNLLEVCELLDLRVC
jgi:hypothetical protein